MMINVSPILYVFCICYKLNFHSFCLSLLLLFYSLIACSIIFIEIQIYFIQMDNNANNMDVCWEVWCGKTSPFACDVQTHKAHSDQKKKKMMEVYFRSTLLRMFADPQQCCVNKYALNTMLIIWSSNILVPLLFLATWMIWTGYRSLITSPLNRMSSGPEWRPLVLLRPTSPSRIFTSSEL